MKRRMAKIHWWRARNVWSIVFSNRCMHFKRLVIRAQIETVLQDKSPRAYMKGRVVIIPHGDWAEVV